MTASAAGELAVHGSRGIRLVRGAGALVWDEHGNEYVDCVSSNGAAILGHAHPHVTEALTRQAGTLSSVAGAFEHVQKDRLIERLVDLAPEGLTRVFFCNSGTEAVEAALKLARVATGRSKIVAAKRGFHGRTFGSMSVTFNPAQHALFAPVLGDCEFIAFNKTSDLDAALDESVSALVLELVQGEGGVYPAEQEFVSRAASLCRRHGIVLIIDEVQTGFGRTGKMFACEHYAVEPDIMCLAKGIAGGFPMGAVLVRDELAFPPGSHGSTFGGSPLACAVANAVLDVLTAGRLIDDVADKGDRFRESLPLPTRGLGLMVGVPLREPARPFLPLLADKGVLGLTAGKKVLRFLPPLIVSEGELARVAAAMRAVLPADDAPV